MPKTKKMKRLCIILWVLCCFYLKPNAQTFTSLKNNPDSIEIEVLGVEVIIEGVDENTTSYSITTEKGEKVSCISNRGTLRIRSVYNTDGTVHIKIPKNHIIERLRITSAMSNISVKNISAVHTHILLTRGDISIKDSHFKTSVITQNTGVLSFEAGIKSSALCLSNVQGSVHYLGTTNEYHLDYSIAGSFLKVNGNTISNIHGMFGNSNAIKRALLSLSASTIELSFP